MAAFRTFTPKRRNITTVVTSHSAHKVELRIDFKERCGWCNAPDSWKLTYYEIDHFIPEAILTIKTNTDYSNLIYSCRSCNNSKRKKWPTNDETIPNANDEGWIDPCDDLYNTHFSRSTTGEIKYETPLGKWMYNALQLHKPQHQVIFNLEQLNELIEQIEALHQTISNEAIKDLLLSLYRKYKEYITKFRQF